MATSVGQVFEVYASKTEADAKALASSKPGAMCFTTDTHRIVFNGVVYNLVEIINNLTDASTTKALSAAQGKALKALIDALPTVDEMNTAINGKLGSVYRVMGTKANISEVLALTNAVKGDTWNVTAEFTLGGKKYPAGTNVVCVTNTSSSDHNDDNWDALGGTVDLSAFLKAADAANTYLKKTDASSTYATKTELNNHTGNKNNPHGVTKSQVGLGNVTDDAQVKRSEVMDNYKMAKIASTSNVPSATAFKQAAEYAEMFPVSFDGIEAGTKTIQSSSTSTAGGMVIWLDDMKKFAYKGTDGKYYNNWAIANSPNPALVNAELVKDTVTNGPIPGKCYITNGTLFFSTGTDLAYVANFTELSNSLSDTSTAKALTAAQGKALNDKLTTTTTTANAAKTNADKAVAALTIK